MTVIRAEQAGDKAACFDIRRAVFIAEQSIPEAEEWDSHDADAWHFLMRIDGQPAATARVIVQGDTAKIGRVAVLAHFRGTGKGAAMMQAVMQAARAEGLRKAALEAQLSAIGFYEGLGYVAEGPEYDDGSGILHRLMRAKL